MRLWSSTVIDTLVGSRNERVQQQPGSRQPCQSHKQMLIICFIPQVTHEGHRKLPRLDRPPHSTIPSWVNNFCKIIGWSLIYFLIYAYLNILALSQILSNSLYLFMKLVSIWSRAPHFKLKFSNLTTKLEKQPTVCSLQPTVHPVHTLWGQKYIK